MVNVEELAKWPSALHEMERVVFMNDTPVAPFSERFDAEFSFGDLEEQVTFTHELVEKDHVLSRNDSADGTEVANLEELSDRPSNLNKEEKDVFPNDAVVARLGGRVNTEFSFGDPEEQVPLPHEFALKENLGSRNDCIDAHAIEKLGTRLSSGDLGSQSIRLRELVEKAKSDSADDADFVGAGVDGQFSFGNLVEQTVWPGEIAEIERAACVSSCVLGSAVCGSGARAA
eukprot:TRINITY_DN64404_c0_g1_i1.p1 TRINITY_DN64404_c0_g1~~TRINITY_DN64404_c0_g1_i1.p1  ORF type:complete len:230 (+),score=26.86 TRINITY_DN64404_c0_g1_i1:62-751(+)